MPKAKGRAVPKKVVTKNGVPETGSYNCPLCAIFCESREEFDSHRSTLRHRYNYIVYTFEKHRKRKVKNRHGVEVKCLTSNVVFEPTNGTTKITIDPETEEMIYEFEIANISLHCIQLKYTCLLHSYPTFSICDHNNNIDGGKWLRIHPRCSWYLKVRFKNIGIGTYGVPLLFNFLPEKEVKSKMKPFDIVRILVANVVGPKHIEPEHLYQSPFTGEQWYNIVYTIYGTMDKGKRIHRIKEYSIPDSYYQLTRSWLSPWDGISEEECDLLRCIMTVATEGYDVLRENYKTFFHSLLYIEEIDAITKIEQYNMSNVQLIPVANSDYLELEVPGLAEKRPSLLRRDLIYVRVHNCDGTTEKVQYEGVIRDVKESVVIIAGFAPELLVRIEIENLAFDVRFSFTRYPIYLMHRAIDLIYENDMLDVLFPENNAPQPSLLKGKASIVKFFNGDIKDNPEQQVAVTNILQGTCRPSPYIIFGPPGTGKTVTVVEAILQIKKLLPTSYILLCAPSNAACDYLTQKLSVRCLPSELLRLHSSSRDWETVPEDIRKFSNRRAGIYTFPSTRDMYKYRIIVCTLISAGRMVKMNKNDNDGNESSPHFTHVFIDECGQAQEPEALVAIGGVLGPAFNNRPGGQLIIAGDPEQLGPVCNSLRVEVLRLCEPQQEGEELSKKEMLNKKIGLGISLLERLMTVCPLYEKDPTGAYDGRFITKLRQNFRSHPEILSLSNQLFYENDLQYKCDERILNDKIRDMSLIAKKGKKSSVIFHGVIGHERREGRSPSFFNAFEVDQVMMYMAKFLGPNSACKIEESDIGIISPYIRQVYKLKNALKEKCWSNVEVGTTETFQGREKRIIIISTVRTNRNLLAFDRKFQLGFLANPKRFNVAITRAQSLLIVVGNPILLFQDPHWQELVKLSARLGSYSGCKLMLRDATWIQSVMKSMAHLSLND